MKWILGFLAVLAVANGFDPGLRVKFNIGFDFGGSFFYNVGRTADDVIADGWKSYRRPDSGYLPQLVMYCPEDKTLCVFFDDTSYIAGVQVALREDELTETAFDPIEQGYTKWESYVDGKCTTFWTIQQYFVSEEFLQQSPDERMQSRKDTTILQDGAIWTVGPNKELTRVSINEDDTSDNSDFTEQACIPWMGRHYYYNMTSDTQCTADQIYPWFPLYSDGELVASGFMIFGQLDVKDENRRDWFERPGRFVVQTIVPDGSECMYDLADSPGVLTMHIYYIDDPRGIGFCLW